MRSAIRVATATFANPPALAGNIIDNPSDLGNASWNAFVEVTVSTNVNMAPDGTMTADAVIPSVVNSSNHIIGELTAGTTTAVTWIMRGRFKSAGYNFVEMIIGSNTSFTNFLAYTFDIGGGRIVNLRNATYTGSARIRPLANRWWLCEVILIVPIANATHRCDVHVAASQNPVGSYSGDGAAGIYAWGVEFAPVPN